MRYIPLAAVEEVLGLSRRAVVDRLGDAAILRDAAGRLFIEDFDALDLAADVVPLESLYTAATVQPVEPLEPVQRSDLTDVVDQRSAVHFSALALLDLLGLHRSRDLFDVLGDKLAPPFVVRAIGLKVATTHPGLAAVFIREDLALDAVLASGRFTTRLAAVAALFAANSAHPPIPHRSARRPVTRPDLADLIA